DALAPSALYTRSLHDALPILQEKTSDVDIDALVQAMVPDAQLQQRRNSTATVDRTCEPSLRVRGMTGQGFADISFDVFPGEVLGIAGVVGSGRTELAETLYGLRPGTGSVELNGKSLDRSTPRKSLERGLAYVPEDRHAHGIFLIGDIVDNMTASVLAKVSAAGFISTRKEDELAA